MVISGPNEVVRRLSRAQRVVVFARTPKNQFSSFELSVSLKVQNKAVPTQLRIIDTRAMIDSGASCPLINSRFVEEQGLTLVRKRRPLTLLLADNSFVKSGKITHEVSLRMFVGEHSEVITFDVADIGSDNLILGISVWLGYAGYPDPAGSGAWSGPGRV